MLRFFPYILRLKCDFLKIWCFKVLQSVISVNVISTKIKFSASTKNYVI